MQNGNRVKLKGLTRLGRKIIRQHGNTWKVSIALTYSINIESLERTEKFNGRMITASHWIHTENDPNFEIIRLDIS